MLPRRLHRQTTTFLMVLSLLFAQLALAAYVCPVVTDALAMADMRMADQPCDGMDPQQPVLCHDHMADSGTTFEVAKVPAASLPAVVQVLELPLVLDADADVARVVAAAATPETRPPPDPLFLATLRLRV